MSRREIGLVASSTPTTVQVIAYEAPQVASYLYSECNEMKVVMVVTNIEAVDQAFTGVFDSREAELMAKYVEGSGASKILVKASPVVDLTTRRRPQLPLPPRTKVYMASKGVLEDAFSASYEAFKELYSESPISSWIRIGVLRSHHEVVVKVNVDAVLSKHLAVLGSTGSGKSNMVAVLVDRIAGLGGQVVILDSHGEYSDMEVESEGVKLIPFQAKVNPLKVSPVLLASTLIPEAAATKQRNILRKAIRELNSLHLALGDGKSKADIRLAELIEKAKEELEVDVEDSSGRRYLKALYALIMEMRDKDKAAHGARKDVFDSILLKLEKNIVEYDVYDTEALDPVDLLEPGVVVDVDVSPLPDAARDEVVSYICRQILQRSMTSRTLPTLIVLEEAHLYLKSGVETAAKHAIERVAREGRKYGVGLVIVSQRPKRLDPDVLSQINSLCVMKIMQPEDQSYVKQYSEWLTDEMYAALTTLERGEAILLGEWVRMPVTVLIDKHAGKRRGTTISAAKCWSEERKRREEERKKQRDEEEMIKKAGEVF
ncbi:MAG: ATP-binding protein [Candidatus Nezhaarchaeota archaeon]|nr:ATP-binding protein [Candidatus Nezhaarchaeota archaeon]